MPSNFWLVASMLCLFFIFLMPVLYSVINKHIDKSAETGKKTGLGYWHMMPQRLKEDDTGKNKSHPPF